VSARLSAGACAGAPCSLRAEKKGLQRRQPHQLPACSKLRHHACTCLRARGDKERRAGESATETKRPQPAGAGHLAADDRAAGAGGRVGAGRGCLAKRGCQCPGRGRARPRGGGRRPSAPRSGGRSREASNDRGLDRNARRQGRRARRDHRCAGAGDGERAAGARVLDRLRAQQSRSTRERGGGGGAPPRPAGRGVPEHVGGAPACRPDEHSDERKRGRRRGGAAARPRRVRPCSRDRGRGAMWRRRSRRRPGRSAMPADRAEETKDRDLGAAPGLFGETCALGSPRAGAAGRGRQESPAGHSRI
jgi:hypothetical protein